MARALVYTDLHSHSHKGSTERLHHCQRVLEWTFELAAEHDVDYIFFLGDLFHERSKIDVLNYLRTFEVFLKHMPNARWEAYLLLGNHDMYHKERWDVNSVKPLSAIPRVHVVDRPQRMVLSGRRIDWLPHTENPVKVLADFKEQNGAGDLLLGHVAVHGALLNVCYGTRADVIVEYDNDMVAVDPSVFADWPMTLLGHYHAAQKLAHNVEYVGSPLELTYGEAFQQKHCVLLDLDTMEKTYLVNTFSPRHYIVTPANVRNEDYDLNGAFVRLAVDRLGAKDEVDLKREIADKYRVLSLDTKPRERRAEEDMAAVEVSRAVLRDIRQTLETWMDERGVPDGLDRDRLRAAGLRCLEGA